MKKVLHLVSAMNIGGIETLLMNLLRENCNQKLLKFELLCLYDHEGVFDQEIKKLGYPIHKVKNPQIQIKGIRYLVRISRLTKFLKTNMNDVDIIHIHISSSISAFIPILANKISGINKKIVIHSHNSDGEYKKLHYFGKEILKKMDVVRVACSQQAADWLFGPESESKNKVHIILNGIDTQKFKYSESVRQRMRQELNVDNKTVIGCVGRLAKQKNHGFLIESFRLYHQTHPNSVLVLAGSGPERNSIEKKIANYSLNHCVMLLGDRNDISDLLCAFDIFWFPSLYEGLSLSLLEAQSSGLQILCTDNVSKETVQSDRIHLLPIQDPKLWSLKTDQYINKRTSGSNTCSMDIKNTYRELVNLYHLL